MEKKRKAFARESQYPVFTHTHQENDDLTYLFGDLRTIRNETSHEEKKPCSVTDDTEKVVKYLQERHNIKTPKDFEKTLHQERMVFFSKTLDSVPFKTIDAIIEACKIWIPYIAAEDFSTLVCEQVKDMFRLHACAVCYTISGKELNMCIEHIVPLTQKPPYGHSCCVSYNGHYAINGVYQ